MDVIFTYISLICYGNCRLIYIPVIIPVRRWSQWGLGWGGVGMMTFLAHEHIFDATENWGGDDDVPCI